MVVLYILIFMFLETDKKMRDSEQNGSKHSQNLVSSHFFMDAVFICFNFSQVFELCHIFKVFVSNQYIVILSYILKMRHYNVLGLLCIYF